MPSTSERQHNFMEAVDHDPGFAKRVGVPQGVGEDFVQADEKKANEVGHKEHGLPSSGEPPQVPHGYGR